MLDKAHDLVGVLIRKFGVAYPQETLDHLGDVGVGVASAWVSGGRGEDKVLRNPIDRLTDTKSVLPVHRLDGYLGLHGLENTVQLRLGVT